MAVKKFTKIADDAFEALQLEAGVLLSTFDPANPVAPKSEDIIATTSGGVNAQCQAEYQDFAEDVDNAPNNLMEFKQLTGWTCSLGFSTIKFNAENTAWALGAADTTRGEGFVKVSPRRDVDLSDFKDVWWVGDKANGGAFAIQLLNALSTGGLNIQSSKNSKGKNDVTLTGHVSLANQDQMPMVFYDIDPDDTPSVAGLTLAPEAGNVDMFGTLVSEMQTGLAVNGDKITGTLHYLDEGALVDRWGEGNFMGVKFSDIPDGATSVKVGMSPSYGSGLTELLGDPDMNGAFKVTNKDEQEFVAEITANGVTWTQTFDLSGLVLETA